MPDLVQNLSFSPPSVPPESEHASCERIVAEFPTYPVTDEFLDSPNTVLRKAKTKPDNSKYLWYASEADIVHFVRTFLEDIFFAMKLPFDFAAEISIKHIRPDLSVLMLDKFLVGVVEVKKPGANVLLQRTVLGELLDQMLLVEGFYGMGPIIGILTTAEEWLVAWFPLDSDSFTAVDHNKSTSNEVDAFTTPHKPPQQPSSQTGSPPGGTPSQKSGTIHSIEPTPEDNTVDGDDNLTVDAQMERLLCTTNVLSVRSELPKLLEVLHSCFTQMAIAHTNHRAKLSKCLLKFHKNVEAVTFHPFSYEDVFSIVDFNRFPRKDVKTLIALEDLGRGSTGKAWLAVTTTTKSQSAVCVMKFDNKENTSINLRREKENWDRVYPEFSELVKVEMWSGSDALIMPHFSTILEEERNDFKVRIREVLTEKFARKNIVHTDVRWRNIGKYKDRNGNLAIVIFDLHGLEDYDGAKANHDGWVERSIAELYYIE